MALKSYKLSEKLMKLAESKGFGNKQFAEFVGISENASTAYLKKGRVPETAQLIKIAEKFKVSVDWLLDDLFDQQSHDCVVEETPKTENDILIRKTREILDSETDYAQSLAANIQSFHNAIQTQRDLAALKRDNAELKNNVMELTKSIERIERSARFGGKGDADGNVQNGKG